MATNKSFSESVNAGSDAVPETANYTCDKHQGRIYEMYCKKHKEILCALCILNHRKCDDVEYIPNIAKMLLQQQNKDNISSGLNNLSTELQGIKARLTTYLQEMNTEESDILDSINEFKNNMLRRIEKEAKSSIAKVKSRYKAIHDDVESDLKMVDRVHEDIKNYLSKLEKGTYVDDTEHFVTMKLADRKKTTGDEFASKLLWKPLERNVFECNSILETMLSEGSLGHLNVVERPLGEVINIFVGGDTNKMNSTITSLQSDLLNIGIRSKVIDVHNVNADVLSVCIVSNSSELYGMLNDLKKK